MFVGDAWLFRFDAFQKTLSHVNRIFAKLVVFLVDVSRASARAAPVSNSLPSLAATMALAVDSMKASKAIVP